MIANHLRHHARAGQFEHKRLAISIVTSDQQSDGWRVARLAWADEEQGLQIAGARWHETKGRGE